MKLRDVALLPLRWQFVRAPVVRLLLLREQRRSGVAVDPFSDALKEDPYPLLAEVRERDPVHWMETARGWFVTRYEDVSGLLRDPRMSADRSVLAAGVDGIWRRNSSVQAVLESTVAGLDPPDHTRLRNLVNRAFTPAVVERMRQRIEELTDALLDAAEEEGSVDVMPALAEPLPLKVIAELLGIPEQEHEKLLAWSNDLAAALDLAFTREPFDRADRAVAEMKAFFRPLVEARRHGAEDLLGALVQAEIRGDQLSEEELYSFCIFLFAAGHETTTNLIGNGLLALLHNPEQWQRLVEGQASIEPAVEELLRFDSPVQMTSRLAIEDFELRGKRIRRGDLLMLSLAGANRDPDVYADPDHLDLGRVENRHVAFGLGPHYCIGAPLARLEGQIVFSRLARRFPRLRLAQDAQPRRRQTLTLRAMASLPVELDPRGT